MSSHYFTSESVSEGHPDKVADQISDAVLDAFLTNEPEARVACETLVCPNHVVLAGEFRANAKLDFDAIVRGVLTKIGYVGDAAPDFAAETVKISNHLIPQSAEIAQGVDESDEKAQGAGDQGMMFGYASTETEHLMPAPIHYCHEIMRKLAERRHAGETRLGPDAKCQLTLRYENKKPVGVHTVVVSHQHSPSIAHDAIRDVVMDVLHEVLPDGWLNDDVVFYLNPTGAFSVGGPAADSGLTGRKIIVDSYGGLARHGGGAFSGKDPTKVDRSAAYAARYVAKNVVAAGLADRCEIQLCYAIGIAQPLALFVETFGTGKNGVSDERLTQIIPEVVDLSPHGIRTQLQLNKPIYSPTAAYGHFGRAYNEATGAFSWERLDLVDKLKQAL